MGAALFRVVQPLALAHCFVVLFRNWFSKKTPIRLRLLVHGLIFPEASLEWLVVDIDLAAQPVHPLKRAGLSRASVA
jgi:hypothetical protein